MLAVKGLYENGNIKLLEPIEGIEKAEVVVIVDQEKHAGVPKYTERETVTQLQMNSGFIQSVLASKEEDVWNDL